MNNSDFFKVNQIIKQEIDICEELINNDKFDTLNIMGNRIMENCLFSSDFKLILIGIFIKEMALIYQKIFSSVEPKAFHTSKILGTELIKKVKEFIIDGINEELLWQEFHLFNINTQEYLRDEFEQKLYIENLEFSDFVYKYLIRFLKENESMLYEKYNQFIGGIINILERVFRAHSGRLEFTLISLYLKSLDRLYDYLLIKYYNGESLDKENLKEEIKGYLNFLYSEVSKEKININNFDKVLWEIIKKWRINYIYYLNIAPPGYREHKITKKISLPEETRKVIEEGLKKAIERKL